MKNFLGTITLKHILKKIQEMFASKLDLVNPTGSGNLILGMQNGGGSASSTNSIVSGQSNTCFAANAICVGQYNIINPPSGSGAIYNSAVFGANNTARKAYVLMTGRNNLANSARCTLLGSYLIASGWTQLVFGQYNVEDPRQTDGVKNQYNELGDYVEIVGNGTSETARSNARTLDWNGNQWISGDYTNGNGETLTDAHAKIAELTARIESLEALLSSQS